MLNNTLDNAESLKRFCDHILQNIKPGSVPEEIFLLANDLPKIALFKAAQTGSLWTGSS